MLPGMPQDCGIPHYTFYKRGGGVKINNNKKNKKKVVVPIVLAAAVLVITGVVIYQHPLPGMEGWFPEQKEEPVVVSRQMNEQSIDSQQKESGDELTSVPSQQVVPDPNLPEEIDSFQLDPEKIYQIGDTFQTTSWRGIYKITINSVSMSKDLQGHPKEYFNYSSNKDFPAFNWITDEKGTLISPHSYLFANLTIENLMESSTKVCVNNIRMEAVGDDKRQVLRSLAPSPLYLDLARDQYDGMLTLGPKESKTMTLGYIVYEEELVEGDHLYLQFNLGGTGVAPDESTLYYYPVVDLKLP